MIGDKLMHFDDDNLTFFFDAEELTEMEDMPCLDVSRRLLNLSRADYFLTMLFLCEIDDIFKVKKVIVM